MYRRDGKGHGCCLGDGIDSIPCRAGYILSLHQVDMKKSSFFFSYSDVRLQLLCSWGTESKQLL